MVSSTPLKCMVFVDADKRSTLSKVERACAQIVERDINRNGGIAGKLISIETKPLDAPITSLLDYWLPFLEFRQSHTGFYIFPFVGIDHSQIEKIKSLDTLWCNFARMPAGVELPQNILNFNDMSSRNEMIERIKRAKSCEVVLYIASEERKRLWENGRFPNDEHIINCICSSTAPDRPQLTAAIEKIPPRCKALIFLDVELLADQINQLIFDLESIDFELVQLGAEDPGAEWAFKEDIYPNIDLIQELQNNLPSNLIDHLSEAAFEMRAFEALYLVKSVCDANEISFEAMTAETFIEEVSIGINAIDGVNDIYRGRSNNFYFKQSRALSETLHLYRNCAMDDGKPVVLMTERQPAPLGSTNSYIPVIYAFIDVLKVSEVNLAEGYWCADFELECSGETDNLIESLRVANLSQTVFRFDIERIASNQEEGLFNEKYRIVANLSFYPSVDYYPFDIQDLSIELQLRDSISPALIQPVPTEIMDDTFEIPGWKIINRLSGVVNRKKVEVQGPKLRKKVEILRNPTNLWIVERKDSRAFVKSFVPLLFLFALSWHTTFMPFQELQSALTLNTTVFLASIALYFSADRPKVSGLTLIDQIFFAFYLGVGSTCIAIIFAINHMAFFDNVFVIFKYLLPICTMTFFCSTIVRIRRHRRLKTRKEKINAT